MMSKDTELLRLEEFVEKLLQKFSDLKTERKSLLQTIGEKDAVIARREQTIIECNATIEEKNGVIAGRDEKVAELEAQLNIKNDERNEISNKVNSIMEQIESWELSLDDDENVTDASVEEQEKSGESESGETGQFGDGRIQHDLF